MTSLTIRVAGNAFCHTGDACERVTTGPLPQSFVVDRRAVLHCDRAHVIPSLQAQSAFRVRGSRVTVKTGHRVGT